MFRLLARRVLQPSLVAPHGFHASPVMVLTSSPGRMFSLQESLPHLPVPCLQQTLNKWLKFVEPNISDKEYQQAEMLVTDFLRPGGEGEKLQSLLTNKAQNTVNWLEDWWLKCAYLEYRLPVVVHSSPGIVFTQQKFNTQEDQLRYAAKLVSGILDYKVKIDERSLAVEYMGKHPLCMRQFYAILSSCRIPGKTRDSIVTFSPDKPNPPSHMVVAHNNQFFSVNVYGSNGHPLSTDQLYEQLVKVVESSKELVPPVGILTTDNRNTWWKNYTQLTKDKGNKTSVEEIQRSIFLLCLDNPVHGSMDRASQVAGQMNHGMGSRFNSGNRWCDKTLQFIVSSDGACGLNYEHAPAEGPPIISLVDHALNYIDKAADAGEAVPGMEEPFKLDFTINKEIESAIDSSKDHIDALIKDLDLMAFTFSTFGKTFMKSMRVSPDAFIQVALQLAYFRLYGKNTHTYESGSLRQFQHGRTDTIRSCSAASDEYVHTMVSSASVETKAYHLREAIKAHRQYTEEVIQGQGIDRHLLGLKMTALDNGLDVPDFFMDPLYINSVYWKLSTSQVPSRFNAVLCFGPVVPDGYGVCYNPMPEKINFCISAWNSSPETDSRKLIVSLLQALTDGHDILLHTQNSKL